LSTAVLVNDRALFVKNRIIQINQTAGDLILETGQLLLEYKTNRYWAEDGHDSFDAAIDALQDRGQISFGSRNARNLMAVFEMVSKLGDGAEAAKELGMSKLREIASLRNDGDRQKLLAAAKDMTVEEVQKAAKGARDKAAGRDVDPTDPIIIRHATATQRKFYEECIAVARKEYSLNDDVPEAAVLVDCLLADWRSGVSGASQE
jgi:hypothetical protein